MKFQFEAIDQNGRVVRGVLSAPDEDEAREALFAENTFPKNLEPAPEDAKVTWASKKRVKEAMAERQAQARGEQKAAGSFLEGEPVAQTILLTNGEHAAGTIGLSGEKQVRFESPGGARTIAAADVERARLAGFPARRLEIVMLDGSLLEFRAGFVFSGGVFKRIASRLSRR